MINERYILKKKLGKGRSTVYLCDDSDKLNARFAIKILSHDVTQDEIDSFRKEFITLKYLNHPNIIRAFDFGTVLRNTEQPANKQEAEFDIKTNSKFFTLEFFEGQEFLSYEIKNEEVLRKIITQICAALYYLHQSSYIYYDLKPENILVKDINGESVVKLIDLGLAERLNQKATYEIKGTAEYIAPELLKKQPYDHKVDLYSLGMILYRMVYQKFPFSTDNELKIYKSQVEDEFIYEDTEYSEELVGVIKKLLEKDSTKRYQSVLELLYDLNGKIENNLSIYWDSAPVFSDRKDFLNILNNYLSDQDSSEIFTVKGFEGSGKSSLMDELYYTTKNAIIVKNDRATTGYNFLNRFIKNLIYDEAVFPKFEQNDLAKVDLFLSGESKNSMEDFKTIISKVARECKIVLIIDDFNLYDQLAMEFLKEMIPIMQVNKQKIIFTENSDYDYKSSEIYNMKELNLNPFTEDQLIEFLKERFSDFFPREDLRRVISLYSDLLPGNVGEFIKDLLRLDIIHFLKDRVEITTSDETVKILHSSHEDIYENRLKELTKDEQNAARLLSFINIKIDTELLASLIGRSFGETSEIVEHLGINNILSQRGDSQFLQFTSDGLKDYIYRTTQDKETLHFEIATKIEQSGKIFDNRELSRQYELAKKFQESYHILFDESKDAEKLSAFSYQKDLLLHLLTLPLNSGQIFELKSNLASVYYKLGDFVNSLKYIDEIIQLAEDEDKKVDLLILKGSCLIESGEKKEGKNLLKENLDRVLDSDKKNQMSAEIAYAEFDLDNINGAAEIAQKIIDDGNANPQVKGKCYNLLGLIAISKNGNLDLALNNFEMSLVCYENSNEIIYASTQEMNIGNIYNSKADFKRAREHWFKAIDMNSQIGNLKNEASIMVNLGVQSMVLSDYDISIQHFNEALPKFESLNYSLGKGLVSINLGEIYLSICDYKKSFEMLIEAYRIFKDLENYEELGSTVLMLSHLYFQIGRVDKIRELLVEYQSGDLANSESHQLNIGLIEVMELYLSADYIKARDRLITIKERYSHSNEGLSFVTCIRMFINSCLFLKNYAGVEEQLKDQHYLEMIKNNPYSRAEYYYTLGLISKQRGSDDKKSPIDYLNEAFEIIDNLQITEITWKILYMRGIYLQERGNLNRASDEFKLAEKCLIHLANQVDDKSRPFYLAEKERKYALERIKKFLNNL